MMEAQMGALTTFLQQEFERRCPTGWACRREKHVLPALLEKILGYEARSDVLLEKDDGTRRLWIEFEVSRADPVANHAKFATSHLFQAQRATDCFVSMVSPHVTRGRRNLAANTIALMRRVGMLAFQTVLLPHRTPGEIQRLNHLDSATLGAQELPVEAEIERALLVSEPTLAGTSYDIHLAGDLLEVILNLRQWNEDIQTEQGRARWGCRTVTYFVHDPESQRFAPSKFCAYIAIPSALSSLPAEAVFSNLGRMTIETYVSMNDGTHLLDGGSAQRHLTERLAMTVETRASDPGLPALFDSWLDQHRTSITIHPQGPIFLVPPGWFK
jgi:hypothetical protein